MVSSVKALSIREQKTTEFPLPSWISAPECPPLSPVIRNEYASVFSFDVPRLTGIVPIVVIPPAQPI